MSQVYRDQFTPADLSKLYACFLTHGEVNYGHGLMLQYQNQQTTFEQAKAQALGACYTANSQLLVLIKSQHWVDEQTTVPHKIVGTRPDVFAYDEPDPNGPMRMMAALCEHCTLSKVNKGNATVYNGRTLLQWMRDYVAHSTPGESVTDFILRRNNQQKGNSDV